MPLELYLSDRILCLKPRGEMTSSSIFEWSQTLTQHGNDQSLLLMDVRGISKVSVTVGEFTRLGLEERRRVPKANNVKIAYLASSELVFGFCRVIEQIWAEHAEISVFKVESEALAWLGVSSSDIQSLERKVRAE